MRDDTKNAAQIMAEETCTVVFCRGEEIVKSRKRGVKPLLEMLDAHVDVASFCAADKVVGSAAAYLYTLLKPEELYAPVMSTRAAEILKDAGIAAFSETFVQEIRNRDNTGICPMEDAVRNCTTAEQACEAIRDRLARMQTESGTTSCVHR